LYQFIIRVYLIQYRIIKIISKISFVKHAQKSSGIFLELQKIKDVLEEEEEEDVEREEEKFFFGP